MLCVHESLAFAGPAVSDCRGGWRPRQSARRGPGSAAPGLPTDPKKGRTRRPAARPIPCAPPGLAPGGGQPLGIFTVCLRQPGPGLGQQPAVVRRLLQPAILDGHGLQGSIIGQHGAVAGEDAAAGRRQYGLALDGPQGRGTESGPLRHFQLHGPAENHQRQDREARPGRFSAAAADRPPRADGCYRRGTVASRRALVVDSGEWGVGSG